MTSRGINHTVMALACALGVAWPNLALADWPCYGGDAARSRVTEEGLVLPLSLAWTYRPGQPPAPAWPEPGRELHRLAFDYAFQPVVADGMVLFGSSADDSVRALDAASGKLQWRFTTSGPVRFAPHVVDGKCYVASDDGYVYCLDGATGEIVWQKRLAPSDRQLLGNSRMISRWSCRSGVLLVDGVAYVAAGMWPAEGIYLYALDAATGKVRWCNDASGSMYLDLPHGGASAFTGVAPQGYLLTAGDLLLAPTGRSVPAAFDRTTGELRYYQPAKTQFSGGSWAAISGDFYLNARHGRGPDIESVIGESDPRPGDGLTAYDLADGLPRFELPGLHRAIVAAGMLYAAGGDELQAIELAPLAAGKKATDSVKWRAPFGRTYCLALAGETLLAGGREEIAGFDVASGEKRWAATVEGQVRGLAVAEGRVLASLETGEVQCYAHRSIAVPPLRREEKPVWRVSVLGEPLELAAKLVGSTGVTQGYALVVGAPNSRLALALAARTDLHVINALPDLGQVQSDRRALLESGLYGSRLTVQHLLPGGPLPFPSYFADLVVAVGNADVAAPSELYRVLRPHGGVLCLPNSDKASAGKIFEAAAVPQLERRSNAPWPTVVRGRLPGASDWRSQWADAGKTGIGAETAVDLPLELLWFGGPGPDRMMSRHFRTSTPLCAGGRVFITGQHDVIAIDAYTGRELWSRRIERVGRWGAISRGANVAADETSLYVAVGSNCYRLDQATGKSVAAYALPPGAKAAKPPPVDVVWPSAWQVFGPIPPKAAAPTPGSLARTPEKLTVGGKEYEPAKLATVNGTLDLTWLYGGYGLSPLEPGQAPGPYPRPGARRDNRASGRRAYAFATIDCPRAGRLTIGAGAAWWMQWYLDGKPIYDTLARGNRTRRYAITNHVFSTDVAAGEHTLAVMLRASSVGWCMISAGGGKYEELLRGLVPTDLEQWGYLGVVGDLVLGTRVGGATWEGDAEALFALDRTSGARRWEFTPQQRVLNASIAADDARVFLLDAPSPRAVANAKRRGEPLPTSAALVALDRSRGTTLWRQEDVPAGESFVQCARNVVVVNGMAGYDAASGRRLWRREQRPERPPVILGEQIIAQPHAFDLVTGEPRTTIDALTGEERPWRFPRAYGCGAVVGSPNFLLFRSGAPGFFDFGEDGTTTFGGVRLGCSVNMIPAAGLVLAPEGSSGCTCGYNFQTSLGLASSRRQRDQWYVVEGEAGDGRVRHISINLGAPGDRRRGDARPWLGFPRPIMPSACPAPLDVQVREPAWYYRPTLAAAFEASADPYVYSSGLRAAGKLALRLLPRPPVVVTPCRTPPELDGRLDDDCWRETEPIPFEYGQHRLEPRTELYMRRDAEHLYFAYRRQAVTDRGKPVAFAAAKTGDDAACWFDDEVEVFLTDELRKVALQFGVGCGGGRFDGENRLPRKAFSNLKWNGAWRYAVARDEGEWRAEIAIPLATLAGRKIDVNSLQVNVMSQNVNPRGQARIYLLNPGAGGFGRCQRFVPIVDRPTVVPERLYTVRLHFAEPDELAPGGRVFDVVLQGRTVLDGFDISRAAGGPRRAIIKEFKGIRAADELILSLTPTAEAKTDRLPVISGLEVIRE